MRLLYTIAMIIIGHRGARGLAPENTSSSIQAGLRHLRHSQDMIEFDVRVTKDNVPMLHHNSSMVDQSGHKMKIKQHAYKELLAHFPDLTSLEQALNDIDTKVTAYIEVKQNEPVGPIVGVIKLFLKSGMYSVDQLRLASKDQVVLRELHRALPEVPVIVIERWSGVRAHRRAKEVGAKEVAMNQLWLWWGFIRGFKNSDVNLYAYVLNNPAKARRWAKWGLAGAITDYPDRFER